MAREIEDDKFVLSEDKLLGNFPDFPAFNLITTIHYGDCGYDYPTNEILRTERLMREANCQTFYKIRAQHEPRILVVESNRLIHNYCRCDGLIAFNDGGSSALFSNTGDCPILFLTTADRRFIGLIHCGWRPIRFGIVEQAIKLVNEYSCIEPKDIITAIWPGICPSCYKVGGEFNEYFPGKVVSGHISLADLIWEKLWESGVINIAMAEPLKFCSAHTHENGQFLFYSRRRDGNGCMNAALIAF